ncbi:MAG: histidine kinase [Exiguobacterium profundum]|nr:MAG: histidine kinase [Exiguobacterium profundum]
MADEKPTVVSANDLRMAILRKEMEEIEKAEKAKTDQEKRLKDFADSFMHDHIGDDERAMIQKLVMAAVQNGKFEALVYSFPSDLCTDSGRAINNRLAHWPETLQGKAKELYDRYVAVAKPQGFKLKAAIISFPGGMPGDVGFFLNWAPDQV